MRASEVCIEIGRHYGCAPSKRGDYAARPSNWDRQVCNSYGSYAVKLTFGISGAPARLKGASGVVNTI